MRCNKGNIFFASCTILSSQMPCKIRPEINCVSQSFLLQQWFDVNSCDCSTKLQSRIFTRAFFFETFWPAVYNRTIQIAQRFRRNHIHLKTLSSLEAFENGALLHQCPETMSEFWAKMCRRKRASETYGCVTAALPERKNRRADFSPMFSL